MRRIMSCLLCALLAVGPLLGAEEAPDLPVAAEAMKDVPEGVTGEAKVDVPAEDPAKRDAVKITHEKPARFRFGNLLLGALGGAILSGGVAFLGFARNDKDGSIDYSKVQTLVPLAAGAGAVVGGLVGFLLGATTPTGPTPPTMESSLGGARDFASGSARAMAPSPVQGPQVRLSFEF